MAEELTTTDATCHVQTSQSGVKSILEKASLRASCDYADRDCDMLNKKDIKHSERSIRSTVGCSSSSVEGLAGEKHDGKRKQLITLEMKSGSFEAPTVSKKNYRSEPGKIIFVKQRVETTSKPFSKGTRHKEEASLCAEKEHDLGRFCRKKSPPRTARPQMNEQPFNKVSSHKKKVRFDLEQGAAGGVRDDSTLERPMSFFLRHDRPVRKPSTFLQQFQELTNNDCSSAGTSDPPPPLPDCKPKWQGAAPCLPAIMPERKQYRKKNKQEPEEDFEGWGIPGPAEVKSTLERPISAKLPRYPAHWDKPPNVRPPGRGGQGYFHGVNWNKPEGRALSGLSCEGMPML